MLLAGSIRMFLIRELARGEALHAYLTRLSLLHALPILALCVALLLLP
jgi:hypothetical protein